MALPSLLVLVRHGESEGNVMTPGERALYDKPTHRYDLTELGKSQATKAGKWLAENGYGEFDAHYSSYYKRALDTMSLISPGGRIIEDSRLQEAQRGVYHLMLKEKAWETSEGEKTRFEREGLYHYRPFGGENWPDIEMRVHSFIETLRQEHSGEKVLVVCHGNWLVLFQRVIQGWPIDRCLVEYKNTNNCGITIYKCYGSNKRSDMIPVCYNEIPWDSPNA